MGGGQQKEKFKLSLWNVTRNTSFENFMEKFLEVFSNIMRCMPKIVILIKKNYFWNRCLSY